jgi:ABC-type multidrug transport system permease subunit
MADLQSLKELYLTRLREFYRQPARIFWVYGFPTILALGLGLAFRSRPPEAAEVVVVDNAASGPLVQAMKGNDRFKLDVTSEADALQRLRTGKTGLVIEPLTSGSVTYRFDPTRPDAVAARAAFDDALQRAKGRADAFPTKDELVREPGSRYIDFLIPGLIGLNTMGGGLWGVGFLIVNFRIGKLLKRFMATPMPRENFLLAIMGARLTFLIPDCGVLLLLGWSCFGMPMRGNFLAFVAIELIGAMAFAGIGLLVGSRVRTTETVSGLMNLIMLPMWLFSGVFFRSSTFPGWMQPFIQALPLTQLVSALRMNLLEGAGFGSFEVLKAIAILAGWAIVTFAIALRIFRWQ